MNLQTYILPLAHIFMTGSVYLTLSITGEDYNSWFVVSSMFSFILFSLSIKRNKKVLYFSWSLHNCVSSMVQGKCHLQKCFLNNSFIWLHLYSTDHPQVEYSSGSPAHLPLLSRIQPTKGKLINISRGDV